MSLMTLHNTIFPLLFARRISLFPCLGETAFRAHIRIAAAFSAIYLIIKFACACVARRDTRVSMVDRPRVVRRDGCKIPRRRWARERIGDTVGIRMGIIARDNAHKPTIGARGMCINNFYTLARRVSLSSLLSEKQLSFAAASAVFFLSRRERDFARIDSGWACV